MYQVRKPHHILVLLLPFHVAVRFFVSLLIAFLVRELLAARVVLVRGMGLVRLPIFSLNSCRMAHRVSNGLIIRC